ncbi:class I SAM-dependent methyltransferase [Proteiniborus sp.]|uniref:class I SAM-dependent methyltransferase n=1 Tax=Proteiniborus sp. TaxID=2079015 RepID=UPI00332AFF1A
MKKLISKLKSVEGGRVLDVATRDGAFIVKLKEGLKNYEEIIGIDNNEEIINKNNENNTELNIKYLFMDATDMDFEDNSFDIVCMSNTLHHLPDKNKVLNEMKRVLKPGGIFIINELLDENQSPAQMTHVKLHELEGVMNSLLGTYHSKTLKKQETIDLIKDLGVNIEEIFEDYETDREIQKGLANRVLNLSKKVAKLKDYSQYEEIVKLAEDIKKNFDSFGVERSTQLVIMGRI